MARGEIHVQLTVNFPEDAKVRALVRFGRDARACRDLFVQMLLYCKKNLTDGFVPVEEIGILVYPDTPKAGVKDAERLVEVGLVEPVAGGYLLPGFLKRNKSKAEVDAESKAKAQAGRQGGKRSGQVRRREAAPTGQVRTTEVNRKHPASSNEAETKQGASECLNTETEVIGHRSETVPPSAGADAPRADLVLVVDPPEPLDVESTARTILGEYIDHCRKRPPDRVIGHLSKEIKNLLDEGIEPYDVRRGTALWMSRNLHPSTLPSVVNEVMNGRSGGDRRQQATDEKFARALERAKAKDAGEAS